MISGLRMSCESVCIFVCILIFVFLCLKAHRTVSALSQKQEMTRNTSNSTAAADQGQGSATTELLRIKDHLIDVEKSVGFCYIY